jgi:hypothetical protein
MLLFCSLGAIVLAPSAGADTLYTYTGNPFTTFFPPDMCVVGVGECQISFSFEVPSPLPPSFGSGSGAFVTPLAFSMTDGVHTVTQSNSLTQFNIPDFFFFIGTDPSGQIDLWGIEAGMQVGQQTLDLLTDNLPQFTGDSTSNFSGYGTVSVGGAGNLNHPGTWTMSNVPEPSSLMLLGTGLLGMLGLRRKRLV